MTDYSLYFVDESADITRAVEIKANDDAQAVSLADLVGVGRAMELWHQARLVRRFPPEDAETPAAAP